MSCVACRNRKVRCDREKPVCGSCVKSDRECAYLERRTVAPTKRRTPKTLGARLALLEAQLSIRRISLSSQLSATANETEDKIQEIDSHGKPPVNTENLSLNDSDDLLNSANSQNRDCNSLMNEDFASQEVISSGMEEALPPEQVQQELFRIYFDQIHECIPIIHKQRFHTTLKLAPNLGPPLCLQYSMWCLATSVTPKYKKLCEIFYQKARRYAESSEAKGNGEAVTVYHAQCWHLIATFEAQRMYITRAWMSAGKCVRLVQLMGLHRIDKCGSYMGMIPQAKGFIELEERRRTFWAAYLSDRFASKCSGSPMAINEHEIFTNLPTSECAFEHGKAETSISLVDSLADNGAAKLLSPFAGVILATTLLGHTSMHIYNSKKPKPTEKPGNGEFWAKHREIDTNISNMFIHLPEQFKVPAGVRDTNVVFLNMTLQTSAICLHRAAMKTALKYHKDNSFIVQSMNRCITAADAITIAIRRINHNDLSRVNLWSGFCLFLAGVVYCHDLQLGRPPNMQSQPNLVFLLQVLEELEKFHSIAQHFKAHLQLEISALGGDRHHGSGGGGGKQSNSLHSLYRHSQPRSMKERAALLEEFHLSKVLGGLLQHGTDEVSLLDEEDFDERPQTSEYNNVPEAELQRQRSNSRVHSSPGNEHNSGFQITKVLPSQRDVTSGNNYKPQNITHGFTARMEVETWQGPATGAEWQWNSPEFSNRYNPLEGRSEVPVHELFDPIFDKNAYP